jgi:hypothetical protein
VSFAIKVGIVIKTPWEYCPGRFDHALRSDEEPENKHIGGTIMRDAGEPVT